MNLLSKFYSPDINRRNDPFSHWDDFFTHFGVPSEFVSRGLKNMGQDFNPHIEVREKKNNYLVTVELAGIKKEDVKVEFEDNTLFIQGEKKVEKEENEDDSKTHFSERFYGSFSRTIPFDHSIDQDKVEAKFEDGVLKLTLPKLADDKKNSRSITIQ